MGLFNLLEKCVKSDSHTTSIPQDIAEMRQKTMLMGECMTEMNDRMAGIEQERTIPASEAPSFAPIFAVITMTASSTTYVIQTPLPAER